MTNTDQSIDTLITISGTLASIALALVGILAARSSLGHTETIADDLFLFASLGFLIVLATGYCVQKKPSSAHARKLVLIAEWVFAIALFLIVVGAFMLVYVYA